MINKLVICTKLLLLFAINILAQNNSSTNFDDDCAFHLGAAQGVEQPVF